MEYKGYNIDGDGTYGQKIIHSIGSGALPKALQGTFTTDLQARRAVDIYIGLLEKAQELDKVIEVGKAEEAARMSASFGMSLLGE